MGTSEVQVRAPAHFLLVEDDDDHALILLRYLERNKCGSVDRVADGVEAKSYLLQEGEHAGRPRPDVIILDLKLPRMDGHDLLEWVKNEPRLRAIPVVILTRYDSAQDR